MLVFWISKFSFSKQTDKASNNFMGSFFKSFTVRVWAMFEMRLSSEFNKLKSKT